MVPDLRRVARLCHEYGPGRLPRADDPSIGAGYAAASAAVVAAAVFVAVTTLAGALGVESMGGFAPLTLAALPLVVPGAFAAGWATWRYLPLETSFFGPIAGTITVLLTYLFAAALLVPVLLLPFVRSDPLLTAVADTAVLALYIALFAFVLTCWVTIPIGVASGYVYERARVAA